MLTIAQQIADLLSDGIPRTSEEIAGSFPQFSVRNIRRTLSEYSDQFPGSPLNDGTNRKRFGYIAED